MQMNLHTLVDAIVLRDSKSVVRFDNGGSLYEFVCVKMTASNLGRFLQKHGPLAAQHFADVAEPARPGEPLVLFAALGKGESVAITQAQLEKGLPDVAKAMQKRGVLDRPYMIVPGRTDFRIFDCVL